jgi:nucleotidyltransferase substrate binding protein (TIGR01987 family)
MEKLDITSFENALKSLIDILVMYDKNPDDVVVRDATIQRFEYTYSLALKMLSRFINKESKEITHTMTFNQLIRTANQFGLLKSNLEIWDDYRQKRNSTSHTYDEAIALEVMSVVPNFKDDAEFLLSKLKELL